MEVIKLKSIDKLMQLNEEFILTEEEAEKLLSEIREELIMEIYGRLVPKEEKVLLRRPRVRRQMLEKCGKKAFLMPEILKFPIVFPSQALKGKCEPSCALLFSAYLRANEWKKKNPEYVKVAEKAKKMFDKLHCTGQIGVHINEEEQIDVVEFIELLGL